MYFYQILESLRIKLIFWLYTFQLYNIHDEYSNIINSFLDDKQLIALQMNKIKIYLELIEKISHRSEFVGISS